MNPVSDTAFYCTGVRMLDAKKRKSVCNDYYAERFMDKRGKKILRRFKYNTFPNSSNVVRHKIIDDFLREKLDTNNNTPVFIIGCGFDSRAYRLPGGNWVELDEPQIINSKNEKLSTNDCPNPLERLSINFAEESITEKLAHHACNEPCIIIIEGVFLYLAEDTIKQLLMDLQKLFPQHQIVCDLMTKRFLNRYGKILQRKFKKMGAVFQYAPYNPDSIFKIKGYKREKTISIVKTAIALKAVPKIPDFLLNTFLETLQNGYAIYIFSFKQS